MAKGGYMRFNSEAYEKVFPKQEAPKVTIDSMVDTFKPSEGLQSNKPEPQAEVDEEVEPAPATEVEEVGELAGDSDINI